MSTLRLKPELLCAYLDEPWVGTILEIPVVRGIVYLGINICRDVGFWKLWYQFENRAVSLQGCSLLVNLKISTLALSPD